VTVFYFTAFAKQRISLVEKENRATILRSVEKPAQVLFGFTDVLADDGGQVDAKQIEAQIVGDHFRRHRLPGPALTREESIDTQTTRSFGCKSPIFVDGVTMSDLAGDLS
jgi:hypothetical protein